MSDGWISCVQHYVHFFAFPRLTSPHRTQAGCPQLPSCCGHKHCTALHCTALHYTALHCTVATNTALHCTVATNTALHCTALHCTALHCGHKHCTATKIWIALHRSMMHSNVMQYDATNQSYPTLSRALIHPFLKVFWIFWLGTWRVAGGYFNTWNHYEVLWGVLANTLGHKGLATEGLADPSSV